MTTKKTSKGGGLLERFTDKPTTATAAVQEPSNGASGTDGTVTIRMSRANRKTFKRFAEDQGETMQSFTVKLINDALKAKGLKPLE